MKTRILTCLLISLILTGCGWQLRGSKNITANIDALTVSSERAYGTLERALADEMRVQHIADGGNNAWSLMILEQQVEQNIVAFSDTNNAATIEIEMRVRFSVTNNEGKIVIAPNTERIVRLYEVNNNRRLAMDRETELLKKEIHHDMAVSLLRRIDFIAGQKPQ